MTSLAARVLIAPIRFYQRFITPYTPATCRYYPTCSAYAVTALRTRGAIVGTGLTIWRLLRCNPWSSGGIDHVPAKGESGAARRERDNAVGSSTTECSAACVAEERSAGTDSTPEAAPSVAGELIIRRTAA